ncbi:MAG: PAS domain-containing protein, partial [Chloroflexi bacterium]|nr:PAS domain-containing protein [Chloroflexota bacterium]
MDPSYDPLLVVLSALTSVAGSYVGLSLASRLKCTTGRRYWIWLLSAAGAMGAGAIWSMHFVAMLAFHLGTMDVGYDLGLTLLSLVIAILFTGAGMWVVARAGSRWVGIAAAGIVMGLGVAAMHYTGMVAMRMEAHVSYDPLLVGASLLIAVAASAAALWLSFDVRTTRWRGGASLVMAAAVLGMHYTGMAAASYTSAHHRTVSGPTWEVSPALLGGGALAVTLVLLLFGLNWAFADQRARKKLAKLDTDEARLRLTLDSVPQMIWSMRTDGSEEYYNAQWREFTGIPFGDDVSVRRIDLVHPEDRERALASWRECVAKQSPYEAEYRLLHKSGEYRWILSLGRPHLDHSGQIARWYGTCTDIHDRVVAREALRGSEERAKLILNSLPQIIWSAGPDGRIDFVSDYWRKFCGASDSGDEWIGTFHPDDQEGVWANWQHSIKMAAPYEGEFRIRHRSGEDRWMLGRALPELDATGEVVRWYGTCIDVHERVAAQQALNESEALNRGIIEAGPDCVSILDLDGNVVFSNKAALRAYGLEDDALLVGRPWGHRLDEAALVERNNALAAAQEGGLGRLTLRLLSSTGELHWFESLVAPVFDAQGKPIRFVVISRDITHQKAIEDQVRWTAAHDPLTKLPNRALFQQRLQEAIGRAESGGRGFAL